MIKHAINFIRLLPLLIVIPTLISCVVATPQKKRPNTIHEYPQQALPPLPEDADLTQVHKQLRLLKSQRYLTTNGKIKVIPSEYEDVRWDGHIEKVKVEEYTQEEEGRIVIPVGSD